MGFEVFQIVLASVKGLRWRKTSKCKRLIKQVKCRLIMKKSRRNAIIRQLHFDIAQLLQNGLCDIAQSRAEQLYKDQCMLSAYGQIEQFCDCIYTNIGSIGRHSNLSNDVSEALSSLIFAASRCGGDVPELHALRNLFKQHFGQDFERASVELLPGNNVNPQIKHNLRSKFVVPDDVKLQLINEIAKEVTLCPGTSQINHQNLVSECQKEQMSSLSLKKCVFKKKDILLDLASRDNKVDYRLQASNMLQRIRSNFSLSACKRLVSSWLNSFGESDSTAAVHAQNNKHDQLSSFNRKMFSDKRRNGLLRNDYKSLGHNKVSSVSKSHDLQDSKYEQEVVTENHEGRGDELEPRLSHVHPKLPDYDELVAEFTDLKKDYMQKKFS